MSEAILQSEARSAHTVIRDRCRQIGVPTWRYGVSGDVATRPVESGIPGAWLRSRVVERIVNDVAAGWFKTEDIAMVEAFPGCWLVPLVETQRRKRREITVAMALGPAALTSEQFMAACQSASLDAEATCSALRPFAVFTPVAARQVAAMLGWTSADLLELTQRRDEVGSFSRQLAESYEEISLLYKLGKSMNELEHPHRFVRLACQELLAVLPFKWIAARFTPGHHEGLAMAGATFEAGELPCSREEFERVAEALMAETDNETRIVSNHHRLGRIGAEAGQMLMHPIYCESQRVGALFAGQKQGEDHEVTSIDMKMLDAAVGNIAILLQNARLYDGRQRMFLGTLEALTASIDAKDPYTCGHSERVAHVASLLSREMGQGEELSERVRIAGLIHDIGKIGVPESTLCKPGKLTDEEYAQIKRHPEIGHQILRDIPLLDDALPGVLYHHERFDGRGYPHKLAGESIPLIARIIGLADAFDAMSSNRTYRPAMPRERVLEEIAKGAGTQFDPALARIFNRVNLAEYDAMVARHHALAERGADRFGRTGLAS